MKIKKSELKNILKEELAGSKFPDDPYVQGVLVSYFPKPLREKYVKAIHNHRLKREIIATQISNNLINEILQDYLSSKEKNLIPWVFGCMTLTSKP